MATNADAKLKAIAARNSEEAARLRSLRRVRRRIQGIALDAFLSLASKLPALIEAVGEERAERSLISEWKGEINRVIP